MTHRIRIARKRLMVARERELAKWRAYWAKPATKENESDPAQVRWGNAGLTLRAIERRKEKTC